MHPLHDALGVHVVQQGNGLRGGSSHTQPSQMHTVPAGPSRFSIQNAARLGVWLVLIVQCHRSLAALPNEGSTQSAAVLCGMR